MTGTTTAASIVSPHDQKVTFVELFFDLVFVFSVTQVVGLLHDGLDAVHIGRAVLVFWLVWWAWTQFTWALNAADTTHPAVRLGTLAATGVAFFMAVTIPDAFAGAGLLFAIAYVAVRSLGLGLYGWVAAAADPSQHAAVRTFSLVSMGGLAAVLIGGFTDDSTRYILWGLAIFLDVIAANIGARSESWNLHPDHFGERHGLFVIIALGESLIVAAAGLTGAEWDISLAAVAVLAVATTCALWWSYFARAKPELDRALERAVGSRAAAMARDVFSLFHFPMVCGIIAYAVAIEEAIAHPAGTFALAPRAALAAAVLLFLGGMGTATLRAGGGLLRARLVLSILTGATLVLLPLTPVAALAVALLGTGATAALEGRIRPRTGPRRLDLDEPGSA